MKIEPAHQPWSWTVTIERDGVSLGPEVERRRLEMADLDALTSSMPIERTIPGGKLVFYKMGARLRVKINANPLPLYARPAGSIGSVPWSGVVRAIEEIERRRTG